MTNDQPSGGVSIGNITGGIHGSIIAGRDVGRATISAGGHPTLADKDPTLDELKQLLAEIQRELAEITAQQEALEAVSPAAPSTTHGAAQSVREVAEKLEPAMRTEAARSVYQRLTEATTLLSTILAGAKT